MNVSTFASIFPLLLLLLLDFIHTHTHACVDSQIRIFGYVGMYMYTVHVSKFMAKSFDNTFEALNQLFRLTVHVFSLCRGCLVNIAVGEMKMDDEEWKGKSDNDEYNCELTHIVRI